jgi:hypothetical protein
MWIRPSSLAIHRPTGHSRLRLLTRLVGALLLEQNDEWQLQRLQIFTLI